MKKLTIEQKAKAYDEAIKRGLDYIRHTPATEMVTRQDIFEAIFPEFKESEDEKLRKEMLQIAKESEDSFYMVLTPNKRETLIALLEKQGQQKEINLDKILKHYPRETELYSPLYGKLWLAEVDEEWGIITCYKHPLGKGCTRAILKQEDTVFFYSNGTTGLPDFSVSDECMLFLYDSEKQGKQNSTWSEEDEENRKNCIFWLEQAQKYFKQDKDLIYEDKWLIKYIDWLKSIGPYNRQKPSDEQKRICREVYADILSAKGFNLATINSELKRLEEQLDNTVNNHKI